MARLLRHIKILQIFFLILGLALFCYIIYSVGFRQILGSISLVGGFGFFVIILASAVRHLLRSLAWLHCIEEDHRQIRLFDLFNVRLAGDAVRLLSFTGPLLGETSKAVLIRKRLPMVHGMSSIIVENLTYTLGAIFVIISGLILLMINFSTKTSVKIMSAVLSVCMLATIIGIQYAISRRIKAFTRFCDWLHRKTGIQWFGTQAVSVSDTEDKIHDFYKRRGSTFYLVLLLEIAAHFVNIFEIYLILYFIGVNATFMAAYIIEATMKIVNILFFFVPGQIGVLEGSNAILLKMLGLGVSAGVTLSLIEKIRTIFWAGYGLLIWMLAFREKVKSSPKNNPVPTAAPAAVAPTTTAAVRIRELSPEEAFND
jgi:hypothetical protein